MEDAELLLRYVRDGSQEAFAEVVTRRLGMVYSAALRQTAGDAHRAQDAAQMVFTDLAAKARSLCHHQALIGWLYTSTHYAVLKLARTERRRQAREQEAFAMNEDFAPLAAEIPAERLRPLLDDAMAQLGKTDRNALLLRFFDERSLNDVGRALGLSEPAAQKRVERALAKLREILARRGLASTAAALGAALGQEAAAASAPAGLAAAISASAAIASVVGGVGLFTVPLAVAVGIAGAVLSVAVGIIVYHNPSESVLPAGPGSNRASAASSATVVTLGTPDHLPVGPADNDPPPVSEWTSTVQKPSLPDRPAALSPVVFPPSGPDNGNIDGNRVVLTADPGSPLGGLQIFDPAQLDRRPVLSSSVRPHYPLEMRRLGLSGEVLVEFIVNADGRVSRARATKSSRPEFVQAAVEAVSSWKFKAGRRDGHAVSTRMQVPILFNPNSHD